MADVPIQPAVINAITTDVTEEGTHLADVPPYPDTGVRADRRSTTSTPPRTPRWVKVFGIIALVLVLLFVIMMLADMLTGSVNGPARHISSSSVTVGIIALVLVLLFVVITLTRQWPGPYSPQTVLQRHRTSRATTMIMTPRLRKVALTTHVIVSVGWFGAVAGFLALAVAGLTSQDARMVRAADLMMELTGWFVIVPLCLAALLTGLVSSLGTPWGLFRHYWVLAKLLMNVFATVILLIYMQSLGYIAGVAAQTTSSSGDLSGLRSPASVLHAGATLLLLLVATTLSMYKPRGMTRYGWRKQYEQRTAPAAVDAGTPMHPRPSRTVS